MFCVGTGDGSPYELFTIANMDEITVTGADSAIAMVNVVWISACVCSKDVDPGP